VKDLARDTEGRIVAMQCGDGSAYWTLSVDEARAYLQEGNGLLVENPRGWYYTVVVGRGLDGLLVRSSEVEGEHPPLAFTKAAFDE